MSTCNIADFARLHFEQVKARLDHEGIVLIHQQKWSAGELARRIIRLLAADGCRSMRNQMEFISNW